MVRFTYCCKTRDRITRTTQSGHVTLLSRWLATWPADWPAAYSLVTTSHSPLPLHQILLHLTARGTKFCFARGRQHRSQNVILTIDLLQGKVWRIARLPRSHRRSGSTRSTPRFAVWNLNSIASAGYVYLVEISPRDFTSGSGL